MTKDQLVQYLRVCADLADTKGDNIAFVRSDLLRVASDILSDAAAPQIHPDFRPDAKPHCRKCGGDHWVGQCALVDRS